MKLEIGDNSPNYPAGAELEPPRCVSFQRPVWDYLNYPNYPDSPARGVVGDARRMKGSGGKSTLTLRARGRQAYFAWAGEAAGLGVEPSCTASTAAFR